MESQREQAFNIAVDIFGAGEQSKLDVIPHDSGHEIILDGVAISYVMHNGEFWEQTFGTLHPEMVTHIVVAIENYHLSSAPRSS